MGRREFITLLTAAAVLWLLVPAVA